MICCSCTKKVVLNPMVHPQVGLYNCTLNPSGINTPRGVPKYKFPQVRFELTTSACQQEQPQCTVYKYRALTDCATGE